MSGGENAVLGTMAGRSWLSRPYISQLDRDLKSPAIDTLFRICDAPGEPAADLVGRVDAARRRKPRP